MRLQLLDTLRSEIGGWQFACCHLSAVKDCSSKHIVLIDFRDLIGFVGVT